METNKKNSIIKLIIFILLMILFINLIVLIKMNKVIKFDELVYEVFSKHIISNRLTAIVNFITNLGGVIYFIIIAIASLILIKNKKIGFGMSLSIGLSALINKIVKHLVQRPRPDESFRLIEETGYSFPSGHSATSMAFYGFMIYLIDKNIKNKALKISLIAILSLLIILIGLSRVYLGVHYITDVLGGFLVGLMFLIVYIIIYKKLTE